MPPDEVLQAYFLYVSVSFPNMIFPYLSPSQVIIIFCKKYPGGSVLLLLFDIVTSTTELNKCSWWNYFITAQQIKNEIIRSNTWNTPSVPKNAAQMLAPAAIAAAVIIDVPPPVTPPYTSTTIGAETIMDTPSHYKHRNLAISTTH